MKTINSKLNINLSETGNLYLTVYAVYGKKSETDEAEIITYYTTEEAAEETAKFWRETMGYYATFTISKAVFIK